MLTVKELRERIQEREKNEVVNALNTIHQLDVKKHIGEKGKKLAEEILFNKVKTLIISPMACGKTTFSFTDLYDLTRECFAQFIFVSPKVSLIQAMEHKYKCNTCYNGKGITVNGLPVLVTPDSLYKVILSCEDKDKPFIVVVDEVHECELNYLHRPKLWRPFEGFAHPLCCGLLGLTATPDNIIKSIEWDNVIKVNPEVKFQQTPTTSIITNLGNDVESIATHIYKTYKAENRSTVARINDKTKIEEVKKILEGLGIKVSSWFRNNDSESDDKLLTEMLNAERKSFDILLTTSLIDVGIELYPEQKPNVIDFLDNHSRIIENIQFLGRFREGVENYHMIVNANKGDKEFQEYEEITIELRDKIKKLYDVATEQFESSPVRTTLLKCNYNKETNKYEYAIDEVGINASAFEIYIKQVIADKDRLKAYLTRHFTFNSGEIKLANLPKDYVNLAELQPIIEEIKEDRKAIREQKKEAIAELLETVEELSDRDFSVFTTKPDDMLVADKWVIDPIEDVYNFYWSEDMKEERKRYYNLLDYKDLGTFSDKELWFKSFDSKWYKYFKDKVQVSIINCLFNNKAPLYTIDKSIDKTKIIVYDIRKTIQAFKGKEVGVKLSEKLINEILEYLITSKKSYEKLKVDKLKRYLTLIYNVSSDRNKSITSFKTKITLED